uniref:Actin-binding Rho-activating protein-like n=1 Tax=Hirondellea gigas TaxID=1518452 RepID=A0A2P2HWB9_9CRUS
MPVTLKLHHDGVSGMRSKFAQKVQKHADYQKNCPFSESFDLTSSKNKISKDDPNYGRPEAGSKSEARAHAAQLNINMEMRYLCDMIYDCSDLKTPDGRAAIPFGKLFKMYIRVSDKLVGTLLRARKHGYVHFEGEMLFQGQDDRKMIVLARNINTIKARFGQKALATEGGPVEPWDKDEEEDSGIYSGPALSRRNSNPTGTKAAYVPPKIEDKFMLNIPKLFTRSQSLSDLGCIMFVSENQSDASRGVTPEPGSSDYYSDLDILGVDDDSESDQPESKMFLQATNKHRMSLSPTCLTPRERSRSRASSPAPSMGTIEESREHRIQPLRRKVPGNTRTDTPNNISSQMLSTTTQLLNKVTIELSGPEITHHEDDFQDCLSIPVPQLQITNIPCILVEGISDSN